MYLVKVLISKEIFVDFVRDHDNFKHVEFFGKIFMLK